jgi:arabinose-5-phosphate isomerase
MISMEFLLASGIGVVTACGIWLLLRGRSFPVVLGLSMLLCVALVLPCVEEACGTGVVPTTSTTMMLALGDALAVALLDARGFKAEDFARSHPGGSLGRRLLTHVADVMRKEDAVPRVLPTDTFSALMREMSDKGLGASAIVNDQGQVLGIFTDGDLRRLIEKGVDMRNLSAQEVMKPNPRTLRVDALAAEAAEMMETYRITSLLVVDAQGMLCGAINSNDLMRAKVI